jgi:hypothetical protein
VPVRLVAAIPGLRRHPDADFTRRAPGPIHLGLAGHNVANMHGNYEMHLVDDRCQGSTTGVAGRHYAGRFIDHAHYRTHLYVAMQVGIGDVDKSAENDPRGGHRYPAKLVTHEAIIPSVGEDVLLSLR